MLSLDARLGVDYYLSPTSKLSAGYQLQQYWNVDVFSTSDVNNRLPRLGRAGFAIQVDCELRIVVFDHAITELEDGYIRLIDQTGTTQSI